MATVCYRLSGGHIAGIAVGSVALVAIAVTVGVCVYKKKCDTTGKTGPSHLTGKVSRNKIMVAGYVQYALECILMYMLLRKNIYPTKKETHTVTFSRLVYLFWFKLFNQ